MIENHPLYAFDFDGVICDSAVETSITGWKAAREYLWPSLPEQIPAELIEQFKTVRPALETGYEAILIVRLLFEGVSPHAILTDFANKMNGLIRRDQLDIDKLKQRFGRTRDLWIERDLDHWIAMNPLFPGVQSTLANIDPKSCFIVTTKQERFVQQILAAHQITLPKEHIFGLDRQLSKPQVLKQLQHQHQGRPILFLEDRLPTLINVQQDPALTDISLLLADWGYNTEQDRQTAAQSDINIITLSQLAEL